MPTTKFFLVTYRDSIGMQNDRQNRIAVIINHWGGVPRCMQGKVCSLQRKHFETIQEDVPLSCTDGSKEFAVCTGDMWFEANRTGMRTVCFGGTKETRRANSRCRHEENRLPDPRRRHIDEGVQECSLFESTQYEGSSFEFDRHTLEQVSRLVLDHADSPVPLLVCVNLLSCRDVCRTRIDVQREPSAHECCSGRPTPVGDSRLLPRSVSMDMFSEVCSPFQRENSERYGEVYTGVPPEHFVTLLQTSEDTLSRLEVEIQRTLETVRSVGARVCLTSSRSLSLGEHGCRDENYPIVSCAKTFWCSDLPMDPFSRERPLRSLLHRFVNMCLGTSLPTDMKTCVCEHP